MLYVGFGLMCCFGEVVYFEMRTGMFLVGALTVKPYSFRYRSWELESRQCVDIFDVYGSSCLFAGSGYACYSCFVVRG